MRKSNILALTLILILSFTLASCTSSSASDYDIKVIVDGKEVEFPDAKPYIDDESWRTLVPVRFVSEALGATVTWDGKKKEVGINGMTKDIKLVIGQTEALVGGEKIELDTEPIITKKRTFVPLRFVSEALGAKVDYNGIEHIVTITTYKTRKAITKLSKQDIERLRTQYQDKIRNTIGGEVPHTYKDFDQLYEYDQESCDLMVKLFNPATLAKYNKPVDAMSGKCNVLKDDMIYRKAEIEWFTDPHLIYYSAIGQYCARGVLQLEVEEDNNLKLDKGKYSVDVEYRVSNSVERGLELEEIIYLSEFYKVVE